MDKKGEQLDIRGNGIIPVIYVPATCLAEAVHKSILACHDEGRRVETPKQKPGMTLGYDADMIVRIEIPDSEPKICFPGYYEDERGTIQYILEVTHGIHNHWKKNPNDPNDTKWGYTYNERFVNQIPFILARIKKDWDDKKRISGRDYQFVTWRADEDIILEQEDPPCLQRGQFRFVQDSRGDIVMGYITDWRSRDLLKAWNENIVGQIELMKLFRDKVSNMLGIPIKLGSYIDRSSSLHLYGLYVDRDDLENIINNMKRDGWEKRSMSLEDYLGDRTELKRIVAAQTDATDRGLGTNLNSSALKDLGYDLANFPYPTEWDTWPKSWDREADPALLRRS